MTGRDLLLALLSLNPADLDREVIVKYQDPVGYDDEISDDVSMALEEASTRELLRPPLSANKMIPVIVIR